MNEDAWVKHILRRNDLALRITHLTRRTKNLSALEVLYKILDEKCIKASGYEGYIRRGKMAVCFQELPLHSLAETALLELEAYGSHPLTDQSASNIVMPRYEAYGLRFNRGTMYARGARPVIYGTNEELDQIPDGQQFRCVQMKLESTLNIIDWSHEREWRYPGNFTFEYSDVEVILANKESYKEFVKHYRGNPLLDEINGIIVLDSSLR